MTPNYPQMVAQTLAELPVNKQAEIYDFAEFVKKKSTIRSKHTKPGKSVFDMFGSVESKETDVAQNHDKYLYE